MDEALAEMDAARAWRSSRTMPKSVLNRANVLKSLGRLEEALAEYDRALALKPGWPQAENNRGTVLQGAGPLSRKRWPPTIGRWRPRPTMPKR